MSNMELCEGRTTRYQAKADAAPRVTFPRRKKVQTLVNGALVVAAFLFVTGVVLGVFP
ncbi:hypothetical protein MRS76_14360 [Rhizobiaceae bacterium n13]|uniref:Uncharacterized protein n=1 Tax=Ferirhizobium litorale TaxID=2927786 RepID=A0AAE3QFX5_9HYPH|nr:hypothetical protein [Fererhizobium litorale]MDI7863139.1 hypothetical protein [Fererhizobium litorale]MDI7923183.1 hypothetical protein [Fererhizobium litorale]